MGIIALIAFGIFLVGYVIGMAVFSKSREQILYVFVCGIAAVVVSAAIIYAGCSMMLGNI